MTGSSDQVARTESMLTAIELGIDVAEFRFRSLVERYDFLELEAEHRARVERGDHSWIEVA